MREHNGYRVVSGQHRLDAVLHARNEVFVDVMGESGRAKVQRTADGLLVCKDSRHLPLLGRLDAG